MRKVWAANTVLFCVCLYGIIYLQEKYPPQNPSEKTSFSFNEGFSTFSSTSIRFLSFGYERAASSLLWLRFLQHTPPKKIPKNEVSWIYLDLNTISDLDPELDAVFTLGGVFLSVITEDKIGAKELLKKGVELFPTNWKIRSILAYHYHFELNEPEKALEHYKIISAEPNTPPIYKIMMANLINKRGNTEHALSILVDMKKSTNNPDLIKRIDQKIDAIQKEQRNK